jgi:hypothetical protein
MLSALVSLGYAVQAATPTLAFCASLVHVCVVPLCRLQPHADHADFLAKAVIIAGLIAQVRAWSGLLRHDPTKPRRGFRAAAQAAVDAPSKNVTVLTQNIWAHYLATPLSQFVEHDAKERRAITTMNGLDFSGRFCAFARYVEQARVDVVMVRRRF